MRLCTIEGCGKPHRGRGLCNAHLLRLQRHGSPLASYREERSKPWLFLKAAIAHTGNDCLLWPYNRKSGQWGGYGKIRVGTKQARTHILVCEAVYGPQPSPHHQVAHSCGQPACVNPMHLRWATPRENAADRAPHGTENYGTKNGSAKLTEAQVQVIRASDLPGPMLAAAFGVRRGTINKIRRGKLWNWLP